ncbi:MAG: extracellular solute-binding protein [Treponema sp.]|jgi:ABC-type glycerol-3-phosphate transport system substrate-binding protein|nr:extracellular solute-binding protein [Treponema sp.]
MNKKNKWIAITRWCIGALVLTVLPIMASCNRGGNRENQITEKDKEVNLIFRTWSPSPGDEWEQTMAAWNAKKTGINVELQQFQYSDHVQALKVNIASGEGPDLYGLQTGAIMKEFQDFTLDVAPKAVETWGSDWEKKFLPSLMEMVKGSLDSYYGLPLGSNYAGLIWANMSYFDKYNVKIPVNYNDLLAAAKTFRANGELPLLIGAKDDWINLDMFINIAADINASKLYDAIEGNVPFTDPEIVQAMTIWKNLFDNGIFQDGALGVNVYNDMSTLFETEKKAPLICNGAWVVNGIDNFGTGETYDVFTIDWNNDGKPAPVAPNVEVVLSINKEGKHLNETWLFYSWFVTEGIRYIIDYNIQYLPAQVDHTINASKFSPEMQKDLGKILAIGQSRAVGYREIAYPRLKQTIADQLKAVVLGESTPQAALQIIETASRAEKR